MLGNIVEQKKEVAEHGTITTLQICHPCRVDMTFGGFLVAIALAIVVGLLNFGVIFFADRFFTVLIFIAVALLVLAFYRLVMVVVYSVAKKATGGSPLANATAALKKGNTDRALEIIESLDGDMTSNPGILVNLTRGLMISGEFEKADQFANVLIEKFPNFQLGYIEKLNARAALGDEESKLQQLVRQANDIDARNGVRSPERSLLLGQANSYIAKIQQLQLTWSTRKR